MAKQPMKCCEDCPGDNTCDKHRVCMCGGSMDDHDALESGHSPISMHEWYCEPVATDPQPMERNIPVQHDEHMYGYRMWLWAGRWDLPHRFPMLNNYSRVITMDAP